MKNYKYVSFLNVWAVIAIVFLAGCASVPMAPPEEDAAAKEFSTHPDKASIFVFRNESMGGAVSMDITLNGEAMGKSGPKTFFHWLVDPGRYEIVSTAENDSALTLDVEQGKQYFIWQEVKMGLLYARNLLQEVDESVGRAGVLECKMIQSPPPDTGQ